MSWAELLAASALEQAAMVRDGRVSSEELVRMYLARIERHNPTLNAFVHVRARGAIAEARKKDAERARGGELPPFHGVPLGIKDLNLLRGSPVRFGARGTPRLIAPVDDITTAQLRRAGFVVLGKLATSELGTMPVTEPDHHPPTRNPWDVAHTSGGSSGGSGSAVAAGLLPISQGSDGAGSIRIPSAFCHLYGIKPSRGRVPNAFGKKDRHILYTCGPLARTVDDAAAMLDVMAGVSVGKPHWAPPPEAPFAELARRAPTGLRVKLVTRNSIGRTDPEIEAAVRAAAKQLESLGHHVEETDPPDGTVEEFLPLWQRLIADFPLVRWLRVQPITRWLVEPGLALDPEQVIARQTELADRIARRFGDADLWVTPTVGLPPPPVGAFASLPPEEGFARAAELGAYTAAFNITGQPAASVPLGLTKAGLPMGVQLAGPLLADGRVLAVSRQLEEALPWRHRVATKFWPAP
jgi:amidase